MKRTNLLCLCACAVSAALILGSCGQPETPAVPDTPVAVTTAADTTEAATPSSGQADAETTEDETAETTAPGTETPASEPAGEAPSQPAPSGGDNQPASSEEPAPEAPPADVPAPKKSVQDIYDEITGKVALNSPMVLPDEFISNYYGVDVSTLDEYVFSMSETAVSAETIAILKSKDSGSTDALAASLQTVIDQKRSEMENYLPDQFQIVDKSSVHVEGNYVYLVISEHADSISQIILDGIR